MDSIRLELDMPPSVNNLYGKNKWGKVYLKEPAKQYARHVKGLIADNLHEIVGFPVSDDMVYHLHVVMYFKSLQNPGWFERFTRGSQKGQRKAKTRYKRIDYDNRIKFLQDCVTKALGIPGDEQIFSGYQEKREGKEGVVVTIEVKKPEDFICQSSTE